MYTIEESKCPYCDSVLTPPPSRKKRCGACNRSFYVRTRCADRKRVIVTEDEIRIIEDEWEKHQLTDDILKGVSNLITESDIQAARKRYPAIINIGDIVWKLLHEKLLMAMKSSDWGLMYDVYYAMSIVLQKEGKDSFAVQVEAQKCKLQEYKLKETEGIIEKVEISTCGTDSCPECQKIAERVLTVSEALEEMPIPVKNCVSIVFGHGRSYCRCHYLGRIPERYYS